MNGAQPNFVGQPSAVLLVDRDYVFRSKVAILLRQEGHDVVEAVDGKQAWELLALSESRAEFGLVIADLHMRGAGRSAFAERIRETFPEMPVVVFSALGDKDTMRSALRLGARDFFEKPLPDASEFCARIAVLIAEASFTRGRRRPTVDNGTPGFGEGYLSLTAREKQILQLTLEGLTSQESGAACGISYRTVEVHRSNTLRKLGLRSTGDLFRYAIRNGLLKADS